MKLKCAASYISTPLLIAGMLFTAGSVLAHDTKTMDGPLLAQAQKPAEQKPAEQKPAGPAQESGIKVPAGGFKALASPEPQARGADRPCNFPKTFTRTTPDTSAPNAGDFGSIFHNATFGTAGPNPMPSFFGRTFVIGKLPPCCTKIISATLSVTYSARIPGGVVGGPNSSNDTGGLVENGAPVSGSYGFIGGTGTVAALWGPTKTINYVVPGPVIASGTVSFQASDNATVTSATLTVNTCCDQ